MTLAELRQIGREVGLSPESITQAARWLDVQPRAGVRRATRRRTGFRRSETGRYRPWRRTNPNTVQMAGLPAQNAGRTERGSGSRVRFSGSRGQFSGSPGQMSGRGGRIADGSEQSPGHAGGLPVDAGSLPMHAGGLPVDADSLPVHAGGFPAPRTDCRMTGADCRRPGQIAGGRGRIFRFARADCRAAGNFSATPGRFSDPRGRYSEARAVSARRSSRAMGHWVRSDSGAAVLLRSTGESIAAR
jgi:hypothetical protein